jgi:hypothetical protein
VGGQISGYLRGSRLQPGDTAEDAGQAAKEGFGD